ncbi:hypothetical protein TWF706_010906 [Orbilia oligospora]|nr:hypothetical protein TWF706_010906 [Orbilia oligospora]
MTAKLKASDYSVGCICAIPIELTAVLAILDETYPQLDAADGDTNLYNFGRIGRHNVVISCLPAGRYGVASAGIVATRMRSTFTKLRFGLIVGVGGGAPSGDNDIRLGDLVISQPTGVSGGVIQYDFGKAMENGEFVRIGSLNAPPSILLNAVAFVKARDQAELGKKISDSAQKIEEGDPRFPYPGQDTDKLFRADYNHVAGEGRQSDTCKSCNASKVVPRSEREYDHPYIHYGIIASGNQVMKDGLKRDRISAQTGALCFEMEAAGLMDDFPCLVIRGICDYSDGHKNKRWQPYAALVAATYAKELLLQIPAVSKDRTDDADTQREMIKEINFAIPFHMPFPRNKQFVGRAEKLEQVHEYFSGSGPMDSHRIFALIGTGGMGKTQTALEYAYRHHRAYTAIFWVSSVSETTIRTSFIDIMQRIVKEQARITWPESPPDYQIIGLKLGIPGLIDEKGTVSANLEAVDNIKSALFSWLQLPGNNRWLLIFDNADDLEAFNIEEYLPNQGSGAIFITSRRPEFSQSAKQVDLDGLDSRSAITLLLNLANLTGSGVPENEATALVKKLGFMPLAISHAGCYINETKLPLEDYMSHYDKAFKTVQSRKPRFGWNYRDDTAVTTWEISFSKVKEQDEEAALLLLVCSYLNPEEIFNNLWENDLLEQLETLSKNHPSTLSTVNNIALIFSNQSKYDKAIQWYNRALASRKKALGKDHPSTLSTVNNIAAIFNKQSKYNKVMQWYDRALTSREKALDKNHPLTLNTVHNIALVFDNQDKYDKAIQ